MGNVSGKENVDQFFDDENSKHMLDSERIDRDARVAQDANDKFAMTQGACEADFGILEDFYEGATVRIGYPNPNFDKGMCIEHCDRPNHYSFFKTPNYDTFTCPKIEWHWANDPTASDAPAMWKTFPGETGDCVVERTCRFSIDANVSIQRHFVRNFARACFEYTVGTLTVVDIDCKIHVTLTLLAKCSLEPEDPALHEVLRKALLAAFADSRASFRYTRASGLAVGNPAPAPDTYSPDMIVQVVKADEAAPANPEIPQQDDVTDLLTTNIKEGFMEHVWRAFFGRIIPMENSGKVEVILSIPAVLDTLVTEEALLFSFKSAAALDSNIPVKLQVDKTTFTYSEDKQNGSICGRRRATGGIYEFKALAPARRARLGLEEVLALRLYTGPMYVLYNAKLRGFPTAIMRLLEGNGYETTIFVLISAISKLTKVTAVPPKRTLYKGLGGMLLSKDFWSAFDACLIFIQIRPAAADPDSSQGIHRAAAVKALIDLGDRLKAKLAPSAAQPAGAGTRGVSEYGAALLERLRQDLPNMGRLEAAAAALGKGQAGGGGEAAGVRVAVKTEGDHVSLIVTLEGATKFDLLEYEEAPALERVSAFISDGLADEGIEARVKLGRIVDRPGDFRGGIEFGMMSTTADRQTALSYSGARHHRPVVLELAAGRVDLGASLKFLSQYPGEDEYLMPPLTCLEVTGPIRVESLELQLDSDAPKTKQDVLFVPVRANVNLKSMTVEEYVVQRKRTHLASFRLMIEELWYEMMGLIDSDEVRKKLREEIKKEDAAQRLVETIVLDCWKVLRRHEAAEERKYNEELFYRERVTEMLQAKTMALSKLRLWMENERARIKVIKNRPLREAHRMWISHLQEQLEAELKPVGEKKELDVKTVPLDGKLGVSRQATGLGPSGTETPEEAQRRAEAERRKRVRKIATEICKCKGLFEDRIDKENDLGEMKLIQSAAEGESAVNLRLLKHAGANIDDGHLDQDLDDPGVTSEGSGADADSQGVMIGRVLDRKSAIMIAAENGHANTVKILHELGACVDDTNEGLTAMMLAAKNGHRESVKTLFELRADIHQLAGDGPEKGKSCLMLAAEHGHCETVRLLFDLGASLWSPISKHLSPFLLAAKNRHYKTVETLYTLARLPYRPSINGLNAIFSVAKEGQRSLLNRLLSTESLRRVASAHEFDAHMQELLDEFNLRNDRTAVAVDSLTYNLQKSQDLPTELKAVRKVLDDQKCRFQTSSAREQSATGDTTNFSNFLDKAIAELEERRLIRGVQGAHQSPDADTAFSSEKDGQPEPGSQNFLQGMVASLALATHFMLEYRGLST